MKDVADSDLRACFAALRLHEEATAPSFEAIVARRPTRRAAIAPLQRGAAAGALALVVLGIWVAVRPAAPDGPIALPAWPKVTEGLLAAGWTAPAGISMRMPSDALARTPHLPAQEQR